MTAAIETRGLTKFYGAARGIEGLDLRVEPGELFGFIGPNGAGKSTTIRTLLGLLAPTAGSARVLGLDCRAQRTQILRQVGYLPGEAQFYRGMRAGEVIRLSARLRGGDFAREAATLCERFALDTAKRVEELSLGNRKKLGIVCAFQHKPPLYILDEPTSGLDPLMQREFFALLGERNAQGATVFLSTHVLIEVQRHCQSAAIIRGGTLAAAGPVETLLSSAARRVHAQGIARAPELPGVLSQSPAAGGVSFLYQGDIRALLDALARSQVRDVSIAEPDIEEAFLHYYERGGEGA